MGPGTRRFVIRRLIQAVPTLFGIITLTFLISRLAPGDPIRLVTFGLDLTGEDIERIRRNYFAFYLMLVLMAIGIGTIVDMDSLEVEVDVNEAYIGRVLPKMPVEAVLNAYPEWKIPAEVIAIIPSADRSKATVKVRIALLNKDTRMVPEMGVKVSFREAAKAAGAPQNEGVRVPGAAIVQRDGKPVAFVVGAGTLMFQGISGYRSANAILRDHTVVTVPVATSMARSVLLKVSAT